MSITSWFDRTFEFTFPVDQYPNICIRLRGTAARLEELVRGIPRDVLIRKPGDKWSVQEHAGHLLDVEPNGRRPAQPQDRGRTPGRCRRACGPMSMRLLSEWSAPR